MRTRSMTMMTAATATALLVLTGCGGPGLSSDPGPDGGTGGTSTGSPGGGLLLDLLATLPDPDDLDTFQLVYGDVAAIAQANETAVPRSGDLDSLMDWATGELHVDEGAGLPLLLSGQLSPQMMNFHEEYLDELGFSLWDITRWAGIDAAPEHATTVETSAGAAELDRAIGAAEDGIWSLGGEDYAVDVAGRTAARPMGESLRIAETAPGRLTLTRDTPSLRGLLAGTGSALDDEDLVAAAGVLDGDGSVSGTVLRGDFEGAGGLPAEFDTVGIGFRAVDGELEITLVYVQDDAEDATANAAAVRELLESGRAQTTGRSYSELLTVDEVVAQGELVIARLSPTEEGRGQVLLSLLYSRDALFSHTD